MIAGLPDEHSIHIRKLDALRDLVQIADLIEMCFPIHLDPDGQIYVQKMRKAAREMRLMSWLSPLAELSNMAASGFVWEQGGRIVGNLSLIPFQQHGQQIHLIANVAVHPAHRQQGIGRALTRRALGYLRRRNEPRVWLQVRVDNLAAQALYRSVGFTHKFVRTTWRMKPSQLNGDAVRLSPKGHFRRRKAADWADQKISLAQAYPDGLRWNLPVNFNWFEPGAFQSMANAVEGVWLRHWTYAIGSEGRGQITRQKTDTYADNLWLAFDEAQESALLPGAIRGVFQHLPQDHPVSIDYPQGRCSALLETIGFQEFRTLIWMACRL